jgi:hypothetical protein
LRRASFAAAIFNFIDLLVNPPWMPMLLAFVVVAGLRGRTERPAILAILVALAWFGGYALTWFSKWLIAYFISTEVDVVANVSAMVLFRLNGDNAKVIHWILAPTIKVAAASILGWGLPLFIAFLVVFFRNIREGDFRWQAFWPLAWPALIPALWFEILSSHSQIHARASSRSAAAAFGVLLAAALLAAGVESFSWWPRAASLEKPRRAVTSSTTAPACRRSCRRSWRRLRRASGSRWRPRRASV